MVPEARVELARLSTTVFETAASAIPPLGREIELYPMFPKAQTEISEHAQKATMQAEETVRTGAERQSEAPFREKMPKQNATPRRAHSPRNSLAYNFDVVGVLARVIGIHRRIFLLTL